MMYLSYSSSTIDIVWIKVLQVNCYVGHEPFTKVLSQMDELSLQKYLHFYRIPKGSGFNLNH